MPDDRLASLGRSAARPHAAVLTIDLFGRLRRADSGLGATFQLPMTQEEIGDAATGMTAVHVNCTMRALCEAGLIERQGTLGTMPDEPRLARVGNQIDRLDGLDTGWLPDAR